MRSFLSTMQDHEELVTSDPATIEDDSFNLVPEANREVSAGVEELEHGSPSNQLAFENKITHENEQIEVQPSNTTNAIECSGRERGLDAGPDISIAYERKEMTDLGHGVLKDPTESGHNYSGDGSQVQTPAPKTLQKRKRLEISEEERDKDSDGERVETDKPCNDDGREKKRTRLLKKKEGRVTRSNVLNDERVDLHQ